MQDQKEFEVKQGIGKNFKNMCIGSKLQQPNTISCSHEGKKKVPCGSNHILNFLVYCEIVQRSLESNLVSLCAF